MEKKKLWKKVLSILCAFSILAGISNQGPAIISKASENGSVEQKTPEEMGYKRLTIEDFNISAATHSATASGSYGSDTGASALNGKYLDVNVQVSSAVSSDNETRISYGGGGAGVYWWGLRVAIYANSIYFGMAVNKSTAGAYSIRLPEGVSATDKLNLKIATNVVGEDLQVDVWLNDVRQERMTFTGCAGEMGNYLGFIVSGPSITIGIPDAPEIGPSEPSVEQKTPEELGYERLVLEDFAIGDDTYKAGSDMVYGNYLKGDSLEGKYLDMDVATGETAGNAYINYGGNIAGGWYGVKFKMLSDAIQIGMCLNEGNSIPYTLRHKDIGLTSATDKFNFKIAVEVSDADVIAHVWINNVRQQPMTFKNCATEIGDWLGIYAKDQTYTVSTPGASDNTSGTPETIDETFRKLTFGNFKIQDGTYAYKNDKHSFVGGAYAMKLHKTVFTGDITLVSGQGDFRYGGKVNGWYGLRFWQENGNLFMEDIDGKTERYLFLPSIAGVSFDKEFNLTITTEYVDSDGDGTKDDVKLGVWFNNKLYKNQYLYLTDYQQYMGRYVGVYSGASVITVKNVAGIETGVDYSIFGYTRNWKEELGIN